MNANRLREIREACEATHRGPPTEKATMLSDLSWLATAGLDLLAEIDRLAAQRGRLLAAAKRALALLTGDGWHGTLGYHPDDPVPAALRAAVAAAEEEKA